MKSRRWFVTNELLQWKQMVASGQYAGPLFTFPNNQSAIDPWEQRRGLQNQVESASTQPLTGPFGLPWIPTDDLPNGEIRFMPPVTPREGMTYLEAMAAEIEEIQGGQQ